MTTWGYARVSTVDQDTAPQFAALRAAGVNDDRIVVDYASGSKTDRPGLSGLLSQLEAGDVLTVWKLDRLGRSVSHLLGVIEDLGRRGVEFRSVTETLDTTTASGRLVFVVMSAVAEFEREMARERTAAALAVARSKNRPLGRPSKVNRHQFRLIHRMHEAGETHTAIAATTGLSRAVVGRVIRAEVPSLVRRFGGPVDPGADELPFYEEA